MQLLYSIKLFCSFRFCRLTIFRFPPLPTPARVTCEKGLEVCTRAVRQCFNSQAIRPFSWTLVVWKRFACSVLGKGLSEERKGKFQENGLKFPISIWHTWSYPGSLAVQEQSQVTWRGDWQSFVKLKLYAWSSPVLYCWRDEAVANWAYVCIRIVSVAFRTLNTFLVGFLPRLTSYAVTDCIFLFPFLSFFFFFKDFLQFANIRNQN